MALAMVGLSHKSAPVEVREKIAFPEGELLEHALHDVCTNECIRGCVIVSTCNRTELYADVVGAPNQGVGALTKFLAHHIENVPCSLLGYTYHAIGTQVVSHLFEVVCSLDSMILGEAQILGQTKRAYAYADNTGATTKTLNHLFRQSFEVGKRVRTETEIGSHSVSISTAAVTLARHIYETLDNRSLLLIGAGEMGELTARYLTEQSPSSALTVVNRTPERARDLVESLGQGKVARLEDLEYELSGADIVISSTAAPGYALTYETVRAARKRSRDRSLLIIDIALPRDVDPLVAELDDVYLYDIDDLNSIIEKGHEHRQQAAESARALIAEEVNSFNLWCQSQEVIPTIQQMRFKAEHIRDKELARAYRKLKNLSPQEQEVIEAMANSIITKMLHGPFARLRKGAHDPDAYMLTQASRYLFGLDSNPTGELTPEQRHTMLQARAQRFHDKTEE